MKVKELPVGFSIPRVSPQTAEAFTVKLNALGADSITIDRVRVRDDLAPWFDLLDLKVDGQSVRLSEAPIPCSAFAGNGLSWSRVRGIAPGAEIELVVFNRHTELPLSFSGWFEAELVRLKKTLPAEVSEVRP